MEKEIKRRGPRIGRLTTAMQVAAERGRIYRAYRNGQLSSEHAKVCDTILCSLRQDFESGAVEAQLAELRALIEPAAHPMLLEAKSIESHRRNKKIESPDRGEEADSQRVCPGP
jgi:hypothetical protein